MVGSSPTSLFSAYFGALNLEKAAILCFPQGLPGFENEHRFAAVQIPGQQPLVYLQSVVTPELCLLTFPVQAIDPLFAPQLRPEDRDTIQIDPEDSNPEDPKLIALSIVATEPDGNTTANLAAPLIVNLRNNLAVQSLQPDPSLSYCHPLNSLKPC